MPQIRLFGHKLAKKYDKIKSQKVRDGKISIYHTRIVLGELLTTNRDEILILTQFAPSGMP